MKNVQSETIGKLRALNFVVETSQTENFLFLKIFAPLPMLKFEAEEQMIRIRLRDEYGGAMCAYSDEIEAKGAFEKSVDDFELFSSANQLKIIDTVARSEPYVDINGQTVTPIDFGELLSDEKNGVLAYFPLHHERFQMVLKRDWVFNFFGPQDIEKVRAYFGDEIGLFYTWVGFYISMLWLPAIWGVFMFIYQTMYGMENPYMLSVGLANVTWGVVFVKLWHTLQSSRSYQWDTLNFEEEEKKIGLLSEFKENPLTLKSVHINEITGEMVDYWYDSGTLWPPTGRKRTQLINKAIIVGFDVIAVVLIHLCWVYAARPLLSDDNVVVGAVVMGSLDFAIKKVSACSCAHRAPCAQGLHRSSESARRTRLDLPSQAPPPMAAE